MRGVKKPSEEGLGGGEQLNAKDYIDANFVDCPLCPRLASPIFLGGTPCPLCGSTYGKVSSKKILEWEESGEIEECVARSKKGFDICIAIYMFCCFLAGVGVAAMIIAAIVECFSWI